MKIILKGVSDFKFDVSLASEESCRNFSSWERDNSQCGYYGYGIKVLIDCFLQES